MVPLGLILETFIRAEKQDILVHQAFVDGMLDLVQFDLFVNFLISEDLIYLSFIEVISLLLLQC